MIMELEEMKKLWVDMSAEREKQKILTDQMVQYMTKSNYQSKLKKIWVPEIVGTIVSIAAALLILMNMQQFNTWYLRGCGIISVFILVILPFLSIRSVHLLQSVNISGINYKETLHAYAKRKKGFVYVQKLAFILGALLMVVILPVMGKLIGGKDLFTESWLWIGYSILFVFFSFYARYVFRQYMKSVSEAEVILKELE
jgi:hypothetical protein